MGSCPLLFFAVAIARIADDDSRYQRDEIAAPPRTKPGRRSASINLYIIINSLISRRTERHRPSRLPRQMLMLCYAPEHREKSGKI
jgi:hypothetical protein